MLRTIIVLSLLVGCLSIDIHFGEVDIYNFGVLSTKRAQSPNLDPQIFVLSEEVSNAIKQGTPIVALESTVISHGMEYPHNVQTGKELEHIIRSYGVTPATIAILDGKIHIGLTEAQLDLLGQLGHSAIKTSRRDIAALVAAGATGATTVAATSWIAHQAGIQVFVTGGLGGVHRGYEQTMDVSADLRELGRTPVAVVCAGVKSILDIGRTLEYLETEGVTVVAFNTTDFPAFFTPSSGFAPSMRLNTTQECANLIVANEALNIGSGIVIGVPIPAEFAAETQSIEAAIQQAIQESITQHITGRAVTPFILKRVSELTQGKSLAANIALIKHNAHVGAQIARDLNNLKHQKTSPKEAPVKYLDAANRPNAVVIGGATVDITGQSTNKAIAYTSNPGKVSHKFGGVGRNIAEAVHRLGGKGSVYLISAVGSDPNGGLLRSSLINLGMNAEFLPTVQGATTAVYNAFLDSDGQMLYAIADMDIFQEITPQMVREHEDLIAAAKVVVLDGNTSPHTLKAAVALAQKYQVPVWFEPTSVAKSVKIMYEDLISSVDYMSPNLHELLRIAHELDSSIDYNRQDVDVKEVAKYAALIMQKGVDGLVVKLGAKGILFASTTPFQVPKDLTESNSWVEEHNKQQIQFLHLDALHVEHIVSVTGAGDSLVGAVVHSHFIEKIDWYHSLVNGLLAAQLSLESECPVSPRLSPQSMRFHGKNE